MRYFSLLFVPLALASGCSKPDAGADDVKNQLNRIEGKQDKSWKAFMAVEGRVTEVEKGNAAALAGIAELNAKRLALEREVAELKARPALGGPGPAPAGGPVVPPGSAPPVGTPAGPVAFPPSPLTGATLLPLGVDELDRRLRENDLARARDDLERERLRRISGGPAPSYLAPGPGPSGYWLTPSRPAVGPVMSRAQKLAFLSQLDRAYRRATGGWILLAEYRPGPASPPIVSTWTFADGETWVKDP